MESHLRRNIDQKKLRKHCVLREKRATDLATTSCSLPRKWDLWQSKCFLSLRLCSHLVMPMFSLPFHQDFVYEAFTSCSTEQEYVLSFVYICVCSVCTAIPHAGRRLVGCCFHLEPSQPRCRNCLDLPGTWSQLPLVTQGQPFTQIKHAERTSSTFHHTLSPWVKEITSSVTPEGTSIHSFTQMCQPSR